MVVFDNIIISNQKFKQGIIARGTFDNSQEPFYSTGNFSNFDCYENHALVLDVCNYKTNFNNLKFYDSSACSIRITGDYNGYQFYNYSFNNIDIHDNYLLQPNSYDYSRQYAFTQYTDYILDTHWGNNRYMPVSGKTIGILCAYSTNVILNNSKFHDNNGVCLEVMSYNNVTVHDSEFYNNKYALSAINVHVDGYDYNRMKYILEYYQQPSLDNIIYFKIHNSVFRNNSGMDGGAIRIQSS